MWSALHTAAGGGSSPRPCAPGARGGFKEPVAWAVARPLGRRLDVHQHGPRSAQPARFLTQRSAASPTVNSESSSLPVPPIPIPKSRSGAYLQLRESTIPAAAAGSGYGSGSGSAPGPRQLAARALGELCLFPLLLMAVGSGGPRSGLGRAVAGWRRGPRGGVAEHRRRRGESRPGRRGRRG